MSAKALDWTTAMFHSPLRFLAAFEFVLDFGAS